MHDCSNTWCPFSHPVQYSGLMLILYAIYLCLCAPSCFSHECWYAYKTQNSLTKSQLSLAISANGIHILFMEEDGLSFQSVFKVALSLAAQHTKC